MTHNLAPELSKVSLDTCTLLKIICTSISYRTKIRPTTLTKFWLGDKFFVRRKILSSENIANYFVWQIFATKFLIDLCCLLFKILQKHELCLTKVLDIKSLDKNILWTKSANFLLCDENFVRRKFWPSNFCYPENIVNIHLQQSLFVNTYLWLDYQLQIWVSNWLLCYDFTSSRSCVNQFRVST